MGGARPAGAQHQVVESPKTFRTGVVKANGVTVRDASRQSADGCNRHSPDRCAPPVQSHSLRELKQRRRHRVTAQEGCQRLSNTCSKGPSWRLKGRSPEGELLAAASALTNGTDGGLDERLEDPAEPLPEPGPGQHLVDGVGVRPKSEMRPVNSGITDVDTITMADSAGHTEVYLGFLAVGICQVVV